MLLKTPVVNQSVVKEYKDKLAKERLKNKIHQTLEGSWDVGEAKRLRQELIVTFVSA